MPAWELMDRLCAEGFSVTRDGEQLWIEPADRLTEELRQAIRQKRADLLAALPLEEPAPPYTDEEQTVYDATLREMAVVLGDCELVELVCLKGGELFVNEQDQLRCRNAVNVPEPIREEVRQRQETLISLLCPRGPPGISRRELETQAVSSHQVIARE